MGTILDRVHSYSVFSVCRCRGGLACKRLLHIPVLLGGDIPLLRDMPRAVRARDGSSFRCHSSELLHVTWMIEHPPFSSRTLGHTAHVVEYQPIYVLRICIAEFLNLYIITVFGNLFHKYMEQSDRCGWCYNQSSASGIGESRQRRHETSHYYMSVGGRRTSYVLQDALLVWNRKLRETMVQNTELRRMVYAFESQQSSQDQLLAEERASLYSPPCQFSDSRKRRTMGRFFQHCLNLLISRCRRKIQENFAAKVIDFVQSSLLAPPPPPGDGNVHRILHIGKKLFPNGDDDNS